MKIKNADEVPAFTAGDLTQIKELLHPGNDGLAIPYSLALASLPPGESSIPHTLRRSSEVYFILKGKGLMYLDGKSRAVHPGDLVYIPPSALQYIQNTGENSLEFLCIVAPPWSPEDEEIL